MLGVVSLGTFMLMLDLSVVAVALPAIRQSFDASFTQLQWVVDAYTITLAAFLVTSGSLADRNGRKRLFQVGLTMFTLSSLACGTAGSATALNISRAAQGIGGAILFATGPALIGNGFRGKERAAAFGIFGASAGFAIACGPLVGGALTSGIDWRWIFLINIPVGLLALFVTGMKVGESRDPSPRSIDWAGQVLFTVALTSLVLAIIRGNAEGWTSPLILSCFLTFGVLFALFLLVEHRRGEQAMIDLALFRIPTFVGMSLVALIANGAGLPSIFLDTTYVQGVLGSTAWGAGVQFMPLTLTLFVAGAAAGALIGRVSFRWLMFTACAALGAGLLSTQLAGAETSWTALIPSMVLTGLGLGLFNPVRAALAISVTEPQKAGIASGINEMICQVGTALGIAGVGALFQSRVSEEFVNSSVGQQLGASAADVAGSISAGAVELAAAATGPLHDAVLVAGQRAFVIGFKDAMVLGAICAFVAAIVALTLLRNKDLHESAQMMTSGGPPEPVNDHEGEQMSGRKNPTRPAELMTVQS